MDRRSLEPRVHRSQFRRPRRRTQGSVSGPRPDLVAAWAVALGIFLILVAATTSSGQTGGVSAGPAGPAGGAAAPPSGGDARSDSSLRRFEAELGLPPDGAVSISTRQQVLAKMSVQGVTWYGPGFYGRRTACGVRLGRATAGVAHRTLPCGTPVTFYYRGSFETVPVIDRGPYARGVSWDLTAATAKSLRLTRSARLRVAHRAPR